MLIFNLTIHHLWGQVLPKFQETRAVVYDDDGYIKAKLSVTIQVRHRPSSKQPQAWFTLVTNFSSIPSALKVSLALVCLLALMFLYGVLWIKHVGIS
jgi:hypothetical protein